jgi:hypothetical protein
MSGFSPEWLALREPADVAARSGAVAAAVASALALRPVIKIIDLGCGTGSNFRYLSPRLPAVQQWRLVDHDARLLAVARSSLPPHVETCVSDLRHLEAGLLADADLVTAAALIDLVSATWIESLVGRCRAAGACLLAALSYDGRMSCSPVDEDDETVRNLVNAHQRTDKGFGAAAGPDAAACLLDALRRAEYEVSHSPSDWLLDAAHVPLQRALLTGWAEAAVQIAPGHRDRLAAWLQRRLAHLDAGDSRLLVGHQDVAGIAAA